MNLSVVAQRVGAALGDAPHLLLGLHLILFL